MSGDVQPRKRKDKKKKKEDLGVEEPSRGTSAIFGEGDVFMHSPSEHGTGGHWCAKVIFFTLLAILLTLIGLIILENRGLSELEANQVQTQYSGVLEGWLEDGADDDHHDIHTLELKHHEDDHDDAPDSEEHDTRLEDDEDDEHGDEEDDDDGSQEHDENDEDEQNSLEDDEENEGFNSDDEADEHEDNDNYSQEDKDEDEEDLDDDDEQDNTNEDDDQLEDVKHDEVDSDELKDQNQEEDDELEIDHDNEELEKIDDENNDDDENSNENEDEEEDDHEEDVDEEVEVEKIEAEASDEEPISVDLPALPEEDDDSQGDEDDNSNVQDEDEDEIDNDEDGDSDGGDDDDDFLDNDDDEPLPVVERITAPAGKPFVEVDEDDSTEATPVDTLEEEEAYEKRQEELRQEKEQASHKDGGNSVEDTWPGEPSDAFWREEMDKAEEELRQGAWSAALKRATAVELSTSCRAKLIEAKALDKLAEENRDNKLLSRSIAAYIEVLKVADGIQDERLLEITNRTLNRIQFRGTYMSAEPIHKLLIRRFPDNPGYRNNLTITYLMANRADLAEDLLKQTLVRWPDDRVALAHYGFILKTQHKSYEDAVKYLSKALEGDTGPATEPRFYYHLGDTLLLLGRYAEAHEIHKRGALKGHFLSPAQRSLYNVDRLKGRPFWSVEQTPYSRLVEALQKSWKDILREGEALRALYEEEKEGLRERGEWSQLDLFVRGREVPGRCALAPITCSIIKSEPAAASCSRGQTKFSLIDAGTHVRPHVGPTNCRLRVHLGLSNTKNTYLRVHKETRQWKAGKVMIFDDSFEHEVWHNGTGSRLVLIVDVWHPQLTTNERRVLPPI